MSILSVSLFKINFRFRNIVEDSENSKVNLTCPGQIWLKMLINHAAWDSFPLNRHKISSMNLLYHSNISLTDQKTGSFAAFDKILSES